MSFLVIFGGVLAVLFLLAFFTKRRFGVLGLALSAGAMLGNLWVGHLTPVIAEAGVKLVAPPLHSVVLAGLILAPALLLLFSGPTYKAKPWRIAGAAAFAVLAAALLLEPLGAALVIEGPGKQAYDIFVQYRVSIITACLGLALADLLMVKLPKHIGKH